MFAGTREIGNRLHSRPSRRVVNRVAIGRKFARLATNAVVARPRLWGLFRRAMRLQFETLAPQWDEIRSPDHLASYEQALEALPAAPRRVLDVGTGTGDGALAVARRFPQATVVGVDLAARMLDIARRKASGSLRRPSPAGPPRRATLNERAPRNRRDMRPDRWGAL